MACDPEVLDNVPLFSLLDDDEKAVLAAQVELKTYAIRQRILGTGRCTADAVTCWLRLRSGHRGG